MIDRDQLREALRMTGIAEFMVQEETLPAHVQVVREAARLVADPDTLVISKVGGEWPKWVLEAWAVRVGSRTTYFAMLDALLAAQSEEGT